MPGEKTGEVISLIWEGSPDAFFVKGHVPESEALAELEMEEVLITGYSKYDKEKGESVWTWLKAILGPAMHRYARWSMEPGPDDTTSILRDYSEPGRGRFPVTQFTVLGWHKSQEFPERELSI